MARHLGPQGRLSDPLSVAEPEEALRELLLDLASLLLTWGVTPRALSDLCSQAFVHAAATTAKLRNGKINQSRVSAQTGLPRAHVRQILSGSTHHSAAVGRESPIELAINGWRSDRAFRSPSGRAKALPITGSKGSFVALARKYAPDVPHRALLRELERTGVAVVSAGLVHLRLSRSEGRGRVLTHRTSRRAPIGVIHRFRFTRGHRTEPRIAGEEFSRLANVISQFKRVLDAEAGLRKRKMRNHDASFVLTLTPLETEVSG